MKLWLAGVVAGATVALALPAASMAQSGCDPSTPQHLTCTIDGGDGQSATLDCKVLLTERFGLSGTADTTGCRADAGDTVVECGSLVVTDITGRYERLGCESHSAADYNECAYRSVDNVAGSRKELNCGPVSIPLSTSAKPKRAKAKKAKKARRAKQRKTRR